MSQAILPPLRRGTGLVAATLIGISEIRELRKLSVTGRNCPARLTVQEYLLQILAIMTGSSYAYTPMAALYQTQLKQCLALRTGISANCLRLAEMAAEFPDA